MNVPWEELTATQNTQAQIDQILQIDKDTPRSIGHVPPGCSRETEPQDRIISHDSMVPGLCRAPEMTVFEKVDPNS